MLHSILRLTRSAPLLLIVACNSTPEPESPPGVNVPGVENTEPTASNAADLPACVTGGCSGELCQEPGTPAPSFTTCMYKREYDCYKTARCARDLQGQCAWETTPELDKCLKVSR